ncbi:DUF2178 domain-containing protein [Clostridium sp. Cult1]|uniref:DUF2178 domain-containing protein n=1 Tax=Clostridium sp. Cult1 TaxID=2079002 RepID=UPI001F32E278
MEDKLKKRKVKRFIFILISLLLGGIIYALLFDNSNQISRFMFPVFFGFLLNALLDLYEYRKHPKLKEKEKQLEKDERLIMIKYKSAYVTHNITIFILAIYYIVTIAKQNEKLSIYIIAIMLFMIIVKRVNQYYWNRKI